VNAERALIETVLAAGRAGLLRSAHDVSDGGLAVALAECCIGNRERVVGAEIDLTAWSTLPLAALLFGEGQGRIVLSTADAAAVLAVSRERGVPAHVIGTTRTGSSELRIVAGPATLRAPISAMVGAYYEAIPRVMIGSPAAIQASEEPSPTESFV
jgi:phosphoribosylformylglycinamidine synthase